MSSEATTCKSPHTTYYYVLRPAVSLPSSMYKIGRCMMRLAHMLCSAVVGELDEELDADLDFEKIRAQPLKPVTHQ